MTEPTPSTSQAKEALGAIRDSQQTLLTEYTPSVLIRLPICLSFAAILFGYGMTEHENNWALAIWVGAVCFILFTALYAYSYRLQGIKIRFFPRSGKSEMTNIYIGLVFALLSLGSRHLRTELGIEFAPHICSFAAGVLFFWLQSKFPTGEIQVEDK